MQVKDLLDIKGYDAIALLPETVVPGAAELFSHVDIGVAIVTDSQGEILGIISERDISRGLAQYGAKITEMRVDELMIRDIVTCDMASSVADAMALMQAKNIRHLLVTGDESKPVGLISMRDMMHLRTDERDEAHPQPCNNSTGRKPVEEGLIRDRKRRLTSKLLSYWTDLRGERKFPSSAEVDPTRISDIWQNCFLLDIVGDANNATFRFIGADLVDRTGLDLTGKPISDVPKNTLVAAALSFLDEVLTKNVPVSRGGEFLSPDGVRVHNRSILLPMSDNGETLSGLLGAVNCREVTVEQSD